LRSKKRTQGHRSHKGSRNAFLLDPTGQMACGERAPHGEYSHQGGVASLIDSEVLERFRSILKEDKRAKKRAWDHRRRARKRNAVGVFKVSEWFAIVRKYKHRCAHCRVRFPINKLTVDHKLALSRGGTNFAYNLQPLCLSCNSKKQANLEPGTEASLFDGKTA
jgi:hypothetical protein